MAFVRILSFVFSVLVALAFLGAGANKLTDQIDPQLHAKLSQAFHKYIELWPIPNFTADHFRLLVGGSEVLFGLLLFVTGLAALPLFIIGVGAAVTHIRLNENEAAIAPAILSAMLLVVLLHYFSARRPEPTKTKTH